MRAAPWAYQYSCTKRAHKTWYVPPAKQTNKQTNRPPLPSNFIYQASLVPNSGATTPHPNTLASTNGRPTTGGAVSISRGVTDLSNTAMAGVKGNGGITINNNNNNVNNNGYSSRGGSSAGDSTTYSR